jgi:hypothetical protein
MEARKGHWKGGPAMVPLLFLFPMTPPIRLLGMVFQVEKACP